MTYAHEVYRTAALMPRNAAATELTRLYGFRCTVALAWVKGRAVLCGKPVTEQHHVFIRDRKAARPWCDHPVNQQLVCHSCNADIQKEADSDLNTLCHLHRVLSLVPDLFAEFWQSAPDAVKEFGQRYQKVGVWYQDCLDGGLEYMLNENIKVALCDLESEESNG